MFNEALTTSEEAGPDDYIQPNLGHALRIWWAFYWRNALISGILSIILHYAVRWTYENTNLHVRYLRPINQLSDYLLSYIVAIFIIHFVLKKNFRHFRIALLSGYGGPGARFEYGGRTSGARLFFPFLAGSSSYIRSEFLWVYSIRVRRSRLFSLARWGSWSVVLWRYLSFTRIFWTKTSGTYVCLSFRVKRSPR
jgi:hypothetical protein